MNVELLNEPKARRWWLLKKGMETTSLRDALLLAQAVEDFLVGRPTSRIAVVSGTDAAAALHELRADDVALSATAQVDAQTESTAGDDRQPEVESNIEARLSGFGQSAVDDAVPTEPKPLPAPDEVVRFLRQNDDVVISAGPGMYLVNGRFRESGDELVARANRIRARRDERPFVFFPAPEHIAGKLNGHASTWKHR
jgi:hypothetical protein